MTPTLRSRPHTSRPWPWRGRWGRGWGREQHPAVWSRLPIGVTIGCVVLAPGPKFTQLHPQEQWGAPRPAVCQLEASGP